jgi:hypothetical protein
VFSDNILSSLFYCKGNVTIVTGKRIDEKRQVIDYDLE